MARKEFSGVVLCASMLLMGGNVAYALDNSPEWSGISFDFTNPGARARGIGGAFVAVADDASAMVTNPAGLNNLERPQIVVEGKYLATSRDDAFIHSNFGDGLEFDTTIDREDTDYANLTYLSLSTPIFNKQFSLGVFYNETMHSENELEIRYDFFQGTIPPLTTHSVDTTLDVDEFGLAFAGSALDGKLKVGVSVSQLDLNIDSTFLASNILGDISLRPYNLRNIGDAEYGFGLGVLVQPNAMFTIGFNANIRPSFDVKTQVSQNFWDDTYIPATGTNNYAFGQLNDPETFARCTPGPGGSSYTCDSEFSMPDTFSIGASFRPNDHWLFSVEGKYVRYSELEDDFIAPFNFLVGVKPGEFEIDDVLELHGGVEYLTFIREKPLAFRLGIYLDPAHELEYSGDYAAFGFDDSVTKGVFDGGDDQIHITAGIGTLLSDSLQLDLAVDYSDEVSQVVASAGYRF